MALANFFKIFIGITLVMIALPNYSQSYSGSIFDKSKIKCGILYAGLRYTKAYLNISNPELIYDLSTVQFSNPKGRKLAVLPSESPTNWDKQIASLHVNDNCRMKVCNSTYLDGNQGNCIWFNRSMPILDKEWSGQISSVGCSCPIENCDKPRCPKIKLRSKDCGRAFLEPSCQICGGQFVAIKRNHLQSHFGEYENRVKSIVVNQGCNLTFFTGKDYQDDAHVLKAGFYEDFDNTLGSYECTCDDNRVNSPIPVPDTPEPENGAAFPKLQDFPGTVPEIQRLARKFPGHKGLDAALTSARHKRSPRNAYILVIGLTGSGKSSAINFLFDNETICEVGSETSTTDSIQEFRIPIQVDELGCKNCELRVIDTPGFGDTSGLETDAKFLAGLETFLDTHEELRYRIPNIVLIFSKFTDNRIKGKASNFVKTLRGIELFKEKLFDLKYSNGITVLTHFMSELKKFQKNPGPKIREFRRIIEEYTLFPKPINVVVAENRPEDHDMVMVNGYYLLPNGEYYPQNLFERIQDTAERGNDPIGEAIIRTAFKFPENFNITSRIFPLKNMTFSKELIYLAELNAGNFNIEMTEVSNITEKIYHEQINHNIKTKFPGTLEYVQRVLNLRNIYTKADVPRTTVGILKLFKNIRQNELVQLLLSKALDLQVPTLEIPLLTGQCFDVLKDSVLPSSPFLTTSRVASDIGFKLPNILTSELTMRTDNLFFLYDTKSEYFKARLNMLKVDGEVVYDFIGPVQPGFNILETFKSRNDIKRGTITALREHRLFQLNLNSDAKFCPIFVERVKSIPPFNAQNHTIVDDWKRFFAKYGTHVIDSAFGGGAIQVEFKLKNLTMASSGAGRLTIKKSMEEYFKFLDDIYLGKNLLSNDIDTTNVSYALKFLGGDFQFAVTDFSSLSIDQTSKLLEGFQESLEYQPTMLQTSMSLIPLSTLVKKINRDLSYKISNATASLLNAKLTYVPPPPPAPPLERPEVRKHIEELKAALQANIDKLNQEMKLSRETYENFTQELVKQNELERQAMKKKLENERANTLASVSLNCVFEQSNLKGDQVCTAQQKNCLSIYMKTVRSVNTYNSCAQFFDNAGCTGKAYIHISNATWNTKFPFDLAAGGRFSVLQCPPIPVPK